jgi:hypothetical protein
MLFDQDHIHPHIYAIPTLGLRINICIPFIIALQESKLPLYAILHQKRGMSYRKNIYMRENKRAKSSSVQKKRE